MVCMKRRAASAVRLFLLGAVSALLVGAAAAQQPAFTPREETPEDFPDAPGREETFYTCTACHNFKLVAQQGMSRQRWDGTLDMMANLHGMAKLEGKDREQVLDYLERAFPERAQAPGGWQNPFLKQ
jgi:hypothetical protein